MNKEEILNHPDFEYLVCGCIKKYKLYGRIDRVGLTIDEFIQEVRCLIWTRKLPDKAIKVSTFIYKKTLYTLGELLTSHKQNTGRAQLIREHLQEKNKKWKHEKSKDLAKVDQDDFMEEFIATARLSEVESGDLANILGGLSQSEAGKARGVTSRAIFQSYYRCIDKMKNMRGVLGEV